MATLHCSPGDTALIVSGPKQNQGKVVKIVGPHPIAKGYRNGDGQMYDAVADMNVRPWRQT